LVTRTYSAIAASSLPWRSSCAFQPLDALWQIALRDIQATEPRARLKAHERDARGGLEGGNRLIEPAVVRVIDRHRIARLRVLEL
jgi:hypothetical protein